MVLRVREFLCFHKLREVSVEDICQFLILIAALELETELEQVCCDVIVQVQEFAILSECVHDNL